MILVTIKSVKKEKVKWESKIKIWKLKEKKVMEEYEQKLKDVNINSFEGVNEKWTHMKDVMMKASVEVRVYCIVRVMCSFKPLVSSMLLFTKMCGRKKKTTLQTQST